MEINLTGNFNKSLNNKSEIKEEKKKSPIFRLKKIVNSDTSSQKINPFTNQLESQNNTPTFSNGPLNPESEMINSLLTDNNVPMNKKIKWWWVFSRDNSLTFLDEKRKKDKLLNFDIIKIDELNATPYYDYTFETEKEINIMRNAYETKLDRALGTSKPQQLNERIVQKSQFNEHRQIQKDDNSNASAGFIGKLINRGR